MDPILLEKMEALLNKRAKEIEKDLNLDIPGAYRISVITDTRPEYRRKYQKLVHIQNGPVVQIVLTYPQENIKNTLIRALKYISNPRAHKDKELFNPTILGDIIHTLEGNVWVKERFSKKTPKKERNIHAFISGEYDTSWTREVTITHKKTGISYTVRGKNRKEWDMEQEAMLHCSRLVHEHLKPKSVALVPIKYPIAARYFVECVHSGAYNGMWDLTYKYAETIH